MSSKIKLVARAVIIGIMLAGLHNSAYPAAYTWSGPLSGTANWNDRDNWGGFGYPSAAGDVANLTADFDGVLNVNLNEAIKIGILNTGDTDAANGAYPTTINAGNAGTLTFDGSYCNAMWYHNPAGDVTFDIAAPVFLEDSINILNDSANYNGRLIISGDISASSAGTKTILWDGSWRVSGGQPYIRLRGAVTDGAGVMAVSCRTSTIGTAPGLYLDNNANSFTGEVRNTPMGVSELIVSVPNSLGDPSVGTTVAAGGGNSMLYLRASVEAEPLTIRGQGWGGGVLWNDRNAVTYGGPITLIGDSRIGAGAWDGSGADLTLDVPSGNSIEGSFNLTFNPVWGPITVKDPIAIGRGSLKKQGRGLLTLDTVGIYTGNTIVDDGTLAMTTAYLDDGSNVSIASGAMMDLRFAGSDVIGEMILDGIPQGPGIYNASTAPGYFTGTGSLQVVPEPGTLAMSAITLLGLLGCGWRRNR